jgi:regulator of protease activity HflC (stomatin/prohibitin superfamily)
MSTAFWVGLVILVPVIGFVAWLLLVDASVRIEPGTVGLLLRRGKATNRALAPGRHFVVPFQKLMVQTYPSRELSYVAGGSSGATTETDMIDSTLRLQLGDRTVAELSYTLRCRLLLDEVRQVHNRFGPDGIWTILRDTSRSTLIATTVAPDVTIDDAFGERFLALEKRLTEALTSSLERVGFELTSFSLREIDLGATGDVIQGTLRATAEVERETARAALRRIRVASDVELSPLLEGTGGDLLLRYQQVESWEDLVQRWNGGNIPSAIASPLTLLPAMPQAERESEATNADEVEPSPEVETP